jgi:hypothetical protein
MGSRPTANPRYLTSGQLTSFEITYKSQKENGKQYLLFGAVRAKLSSLLFVMRKVTLKCTLAFKGSKLIRQGIGIVS